MTSLPLHEIIPNYLVVFSRCPPPNGPGDSNYGEENLYAEWLAKMNVRTVVRLSDDVAADAPLEEAGIRIVALEFDDPVLPPSVVSAFLHEARTSRGAVAVRCDTPRGGAAGLGLCALQLMLAHGFPARDAVAWARLACPPRSVRCRPHLRYLCAVEAEFRACAPGRALRSRAEPIGFDARRRPDNFDQGAELQVAAAAAAGRRVAALQRAVYRVWRERQRPSGPSRLRPASDYDWSGPEATAQDDQLESESPALGPAVSHKASAATASAAPAAAAAAAAAAGSSAHAADSDGRPCRFQACRGGGASERPRADGVGGAPLLEATARLCELLCSLSGSASASAAAALIRGARFGAAAWPTDACDGDAAGPAGRVADAGPAATGCGEPPRRRRWPTTLTRRPTLVYSMVTVAA